MQKKKKIVSPFAIISVCLFLVIGTVHFITERSYSFADLLNGSLSQSFRKFMSSMGELFPFSLFEVLMYCLPLIIAAVVYGAVKAFSDKQRRARFIINFAAVILLIYSGHLLALGIAHNTTPISEKMKLSDVEVNEENLTETLTSLVEEINILAPKVNRDQQGVFTCGYSYPDFSAKISESYKDFAVKYDLPKGYDSTAKGVKSGWAMCYLGIGGIYTYVTGEANVNTAYPDYDTLFTAAHEMSHQRGILRENEANFVAYILLANSDDEGFRYSAALNMYSYFASALYRTNSDAYYEIAKNLSPMAKTDIKASNAVTEKYSDTIFEDISEWINDLYLESSGSGGIVSYSRVVELVVAYRYTER